MHPPEVVAQRVAEVRDRIRRCSPHPDRVRVIGVTKGFTANDARALVAAGVTDLGENYAQELVGKAVEVRGVTWHFLGPVQRNKLGALTPVVGWWHGIDRLSVGEGIARRNPGAKVLVQVNVAGAKQRPGVSWADAEGTVDALRHLDLDVRGLMAVASMAGGAVARSEFSRLASLARALGLEELSMGMSADLDEALAAGSTMVRIGTALLGQRPQSMKARE